MGSFFFGDEVSILDGNRTSAREEVVSYAALAWKSKQKTACVWDEERSLMSMCL